MGYCEDRTMTRVDFFKPSGKWHCTEAVKWTGSYQVGREGQLVQEAFAQSLRDHFKDNPERLIGMDAVCIEPYHEYCYPVMLKYGAWMDYEQDKYFKNKKD